MTTPATPATSAAPRLRRSLTLWDLILYGVIVIQPVAPMSVFGVLSNKGRGHVVTMILIAMIGMLFTAISYGRMARVYPSAGSAFTYVGQEINPALGYVTGWSMVMDYMLNPMICAIWISQQAHVFAPNVSYTIWAIVFVAVFTFLNIQGVKTSARVNTLLAAGMGAVIAIFFVVAARYIFGHPHDEAGFFTRPFYDPASWDIKAVMGGTSIAVLTYIGFDGISTLSEEAENPRRNILLATVLTCLVIGILSAVEVYAAQLVWPASQAFPNEDTAFTFVAARAWQPMFVLVGVTLLVANFGSGMGAQLGAARLLYGMGRSSALPKSFFGAVDPKRHVPRNNVLFVAAVALGGALLVSRGWFSYGLGAEMLNFGALIAFMGVNAAAFIRYFLKGEKKFGNFFPPAAGFLICLMLWLNLSSKAWLVGSIWMAVGIAIGAWKTRGFRGNLIDFELPPEE
ncbi:MAG TPA: APC family permease [Terriglobales bacterium]|jgi:putrescine importer|nr:APC family permease [Terriglobales bacterium]